TQVGAVEVVGDDVDLPLVHAHVVDRHNAGMTQLGKSPRLLQRRFALVLRRASFSAQHFDGHGTIELSIVAEVYGAEATRSQGIPHLITAEGRRWGQDTRLRRGRASIRTCPKSRQQRPNLRVDELELLPPLLDFGQQFGALAAYLLRLLAEFEHL